MGEPGGLPSMGSHRVGHNWSNLAAAAATPTGDGSTSSHINPIPTVSAGHGHHPMHPQILSSCIWPSLEWVIIGAWRVPNILLSCKALTRGKSDLRRHLFGNKVYPSYGYPLPGQRPLQPALGPMRLPGELKADICLHGRRKPTLRMLLGISIINPIVRKSWSFQHRSHLLFPLSGSCHKPGHLLPVGGGPGSTAENGSWRAAWGAFQRHGVQKKFLGLSFAFRHWKYISVPPPISGSFHKVKDPECEGVKYPDWIQMGWTTRLRPASGPRGLLPSGRAVWVCNAFSRQG